MSGQITRIPTLWRMEPIGVKGAAEAVAAYGFCSLDCRTAFNREAETYADGTTWSEAEEPNSFEDGHVCDHCGVTLP